MRFTKVWVARVDVVVVVVFFKLSLLFEHFKIYNTFLENVDNNKDEFNFFFFIGT